MASAATAPPDTGAYKYAVVRSLAGQFLTYDTRFQGYVPYTEVLEGNPSALSFWLNCRQDRYSLRLKTTPGLCLFADRKLFYAFSETGTVLVPLTPLMDSLHGERIFVTLYRSAGHLLETEASLVNTGVLAGSVEPVPGLMPVMASSGPDSGKYAAADSVYMGSVSGQAGKAGISAGVQGASEVPLLKQIPRVRLGMPWYCLLTVLLLAAVYAVYKRYSPKNFLPFFNFTNFLSPDAQIYNTATRKIRNTDLLLLIPANSLGISTALFLIYIHEPTGGIMHGVLPRALAADMPWLFSMPGFAVSGLGYFACKYLLLEGVSKLLGFRLPGNPHYYEFIRFSTLLSMAALLLCLPVYGTYLISEQNYIWLIRFLIVFFFVLRVLRMGFILNKPDKFKYLYLFSYICATELVPMVFIIKLLVP